MKTLVIGFALISLVLSGSFVESTSRSTFLNTHALLLVVVGTLALFFVTSPSSILSSVFKRVFELFKIENSLEKHNQDLLNILEGKEMKNSTVHPLINYALELKERGLSSSVSMALIRARGEEIQMERNKVVAVLRNLAKYPPALGMIGTVIGLVTLFSNLDPDGKSAIGQSLALAMTATFYGLAMSNFLLMPIADRLHHKNLTEAAVNSHIIKVLSLIYEDEGDAFIRDEIYAA